MQRTADDCVIARALEEDVGTGDITTESIVSDGLTAAADLVVRSPGVVCGLAEAELVFRILDPEARLERELEDGTEVTTVPAVAARLTASARAMLTGERTALNLLQRMSGIATAARGYVRAVEGTGVRILDTRKTAPGLRALDKRAVACGGGVNHRDGLDDAVLIKDNHVELAGGVAAAIAAVRAAHPGLAVEVEVDDERQLQAALDAGADAILLDNMSCDELRRAVAMTAGRARLEASGGITLDIVHAVAETGVDDISVGALTHSVRALDIALEVHPWQ